MIWRAYRSHAVHQDMRGNTGAMMTVEMEVVYSSPTRQKNSTKISTETELVAADDTLTQAIWTEVFLEN